MRNSPAGPPQIAESLKIGKGAFTSFDYFVQPARDEIHLGQAGVGKGSDLVETDADASNPASLQDRSPGPVRANRWIGSLTRIVPAACSSRAAILAISPITV